MKAMGGTWESLRLLKKLSVTPFPVKGQKSVHLSEPVVGSRAIYCAHEAGDFTAFDRSTLEVMWKRASEEFWPLRPMDENLILVGKPPNIAGMMEASSGNILWQSETLFAGGTAWRGLLVTERAQGFAVIDPQTGELTRIVTVPGGITRMAAICGDTAVLATRSKGDPVCAVDLSTGRVVWERPMVAEMKAHFGVGEQDPVPAFVSGSLPNRFVATRPGSVFGCSLEEGELLWHAHVLVPYYWPNLYEGRVYVFNFAVRPPSFIAIDEASGDIVYDVKHPALEPALYAKTGTIYAGKIAFSTESGHLPVFDLADGRLVSLYKHNASLGRTAEADGRLLVTTGRGELLVFTDS